MSAQAPNPSEQHDEVLFEEVGDKGLIILNRPKALNALNLSMVHKIQPKLKQWESSKSAIVLKGSGDKAFCAGGDVKSLVLALSEPGGAILGQTFFRNEYSLDYSLGTYKKPVVAIIHGIVMGGGVGLSVHGKYRVATENTLFAMPETAIGLCPDVGATYFLPRLQGKLGLYLGLTGYRLKGTDVLHAGIATHYVPAEKISALTESLLAPGSRDVDQILDEYRSKDLNKKFSLDAHMGQINECFGANTVEEIINRLKKDRTDWSERTLELLSKMSPTAMKVAKLAIEKGEKLSFGDCLKMEYRLSCSALTREGDFYEGVRALLIDKDQKPIWNPKSLEDVTDEHVAKFFTQTPGDGDLEF
ncbi:3-hydroxyisobutyryl-CoA hydrolase, mitochondrial isoform X2 [Venturia canescens]|nr:3-hydroxyisobutyryl-CoA hydrolase, mitochondrial isoform X2 [Venturia canescens]XP_043290183.1 3-hydroxyisobutyryl-CoA hydrolase, mitochondrial isoform X2 [Venturia canescens]XP_043290184.1 3-hydroxyisobutyryl-CoA hydrolase, mitochondrial isoform X2 [Venturia canescens]XP_043290185.1 3-hydroxyisobutyryl-CoA hydrolase, mitochondrial isoform X2 [Venturia canescens]